jgi:hypothetical protein
MKQIGRACLWGADKARLHDQREGNRKKSSSGHHPGPRFELDTFSIQVLRVNAELARPLKALWDVLYW